ncbi:MAG: alpha/beta hydrolase [Pseudomarimonas sp.]
MTTSRTELFGPRWVGWRLLGRGALIAATALLLVGCKASFFATLNAGNPSVESVVYLPEHRLALDVYQPAAQSTPTPVVVFVYGGRWQSGQRSEYAFVGKRLAEAGVLTLVIDYRLWPQVRFPVFVDDTVMAIAWARSHAEQYGGDPKRIFLVGHSAGAHIAALIGTDARHLEAIDWRPRNLAGVVGIAGPYDFLPLEDDDLRDMFGPEANWPESQPVNFVDGDEPPFLLLHGTTDLLVWLRNSERLQARFAAVGTPIELRRYPGVGHIRILSGFRYPWLANTAEDVLDFVSRNPVTPATTP